MTIFWRGALSAGLLATLYVGTVAAAGSIQTLDSIVAAAKSASDQRARQHGYDNVLSEVRPLDSRLQLPQCSEKLTTITPQSNRVLGSINIGVRCTGEKPWTIYIRAMVTAQQSVPVLTRPLARLSIVSKDDIQLINQPVHSTGNGVIYDPNQIIGMELIRPLNAGSPIKVNQLRSPKVVIKGQQVTLVARFGGLDVTIKGKALQSAAVGDRVRVTNLSSGKHVEGVAQADGTVLVP